MTEQRTYNEQPPARGSRLANASLALGVVCLLLPPSGFVVGLKGHPPPGIYAILACLPLGLAGVVLGGVALTVRRPPTRGGMWRATLGLAASALALLLAVIVFLLWTFTVCGSC